MILPVLSVAAALLQHDVRAAPPPPYLVYDAWWGDGTTASSCYYYDGAFTATSDNFYLNCSVVASGPEANAAMNQPRAYSTGSSKLLYTKCNKDSSACSSKDVCWTGWRPTPPHNTTVKPEGCLTNLFLDYFSVDWAESGSGLWRGALPGTSKHNICFVNNLVWSQKPPPRTCIEVEADKTDLKNAILSNDINYYPIVAYTEYNKHTGLHHLCYFNATSQMEATTSTCDHTMGWSNSESPRMVEHNFRFNNFLTVLASRGGGHTGFCTVAANLTGGWSCLQPKEDLGELESFYIEDSFEHNQHHHKATWIVPSRDSSGVIRGCSSLYRDGKWMAPQCSPLMGSQAPMGRTIDFIRGNFFPSRSATFAVELSDGRNVYCSDLYSPSFCHTLPKGLKVTSLSTSLGFVFQALNGMEVNICRFDFFQPGKDSLTCMAVGRLGGKPIHKISPFTDWSAN